MSKIIAPLAAAAIALTAAPFAAVAAAPAAPVRLDISSVDFSNPSQVAAFRSRVAEVQAQLCRRAADKPACREGIMFKINAQLNDAQRAALVATAASPTAGTR